MDPGLSLFDLNDSYVVVDSEDDDEEDEDGEVRDHGSGRRPRLSRAQKEAERVPHPYFLNVDPRNLQPTDVVGKIQFVDLVEATRFYRTYSAGMGFGFRKSSSHKHPETKQLLGKKFVCCLEGIREEQYYKHENRKRAPKMESRINCGAHMRIVRNGSKWIVSQFNIVHNHPMVNSNQIGLIRSNRYVDEAHLKEAIAMKDSGIPTHNVINFFAHRAGGYDKLGFTRKDLYNSLGEYCRERVKLGDAQECINFFTMKRNEDSRFFFDFDVDAENYLERIIWIDSRCRMDYEAFGDVIAFDTTYRKNAYKLPFFSLVGANNHNQTVVFAFALLSRETTANYIWVLSRFLEAMGGVKPKGVVTDGALAMHNAIRETMPEARHRVCCWHIEQNALRNVKITGFVDAFKKVMMSWWTPADFETGFRRMVREFNLENNEWVREKYRTKTMWAQAFLTGDFFATLKSTSRCEGMHSYMKRFVKHTGTLFEFMHAIDKALDAIRQLELQADYQSRFFKHVTRGSPLQKIEEDGARVYTKRAFERFRTEVRREHLYFCTSTPSPEAGGGRKYSLRRYTRPERVIEVIYYEDRALMRCSCQKLETEGIPCRHQICVMKMENLVNIPEGMIYTRWTKDAGNISSYKPRYRVDENERELFRHVSLRVLCNRLCELASKDDEAFEEAKRRIEELCHDIVNRRFARTHGSTWHPCENGNEWFDRDDTDRDGGTRPQRPTPGRCGHCERTGHTIRRCPYINMERVVVRNRGTDENTDYDDSDEDAIFGQQFPYLQEAWDQEEARAARLG